MEKFSLSLLLVLSLCVNLKSQILLDTFSYAGKPGDVRSKSIQVKPSTQIRFIFCSVNVPDHLEVNLCGQGFSSYIGDKQIDPICDEGYRHYKFEGQGLQLVVQSDWVPQSIVNKCNACEYRHGALVVDIKVPEFCCEIDWVVSGNKMFPTIYSLRVEEVNSGYYETLDTIYTYSCIGAYQKYVYENCARYLYVYADSSIKEKPIITQPKCLNPGSIIFPNTPSRSLYNLYDGEYEFTLSNDVCSETYNITLEDDFICNYYFPNAFQPSSLDNRLFQLFFDKPLQYTLFIYDRWGNLLYQENLTSDSNQGWDGTFQNKLCSPGVYIWRAVVHSDQVYYPSGDVTLIE